MKTALLMISLALAGCATTENVWIKANSTEDGFSMDAGQCRAQSESLMYAPPLQRLSVYQACMQGKGWRLEKQPISR